MKKNKTTRNVIIGVIVAGVIAGGYYLSSNVDYSMFYEEASAKEGDIETYYTFNGNVQSQNVQNVVAEKNIFVSEIVVKEKDVVKKGDVLVKFSDGSEITAKQAGTVSIIYVEKEQPVALGTPIMDIYDFDNYEVVVKVDEYDLNSVEIGKEMTVYINALDRELTGEITEVSDTATSLNGVAFFIATIKLPQDEQLKVGMTAEAKTLNEKAEDVVYIPMKAIKVDDEGEAYVYIKDDKGNMVKEEIEVGINDGKYIEVTDGLDKNDTFYYEKANQFEQQMQQPMQQQN